MRPDTILSTERLSLRRWSGEDLAPFARLNADPGVMRFFPSALSAAESDAFARRIEEHFEQRGYGLYAVEERATGDFIGFIGFQVATFEASFTPCTEIGWRLAREYWGRGYATEGARACLRYGFSTLGLEEIYSFTAAVNLPSIAVMKRIGLQFRMEFAHPRIDPSHELSRHVLYAGTRDAYRASVGGAGSPVSL